MSFSSTPLFNQIKSGVEALPENEKKELIKKVNGTFELVVKSKSGEEKVWTLDFKKDGAVTEGKTGAKPDISISLGDDTFLDLASGKLNGQKAFMQGKLKVKGNMMLATRLDAVLKVAKNAPAPSATSSKTTTATGGFQEVPGFESSKVFSQLHAASETLSQEEKDANVKKVKGIFQFDVKNSAGTVQTWTLDLKNTVGMKVGKGDTKPDITISVADSDMVNLALGKLNGQKAFMSGKIKVKGNIMLATKLDGVMKTLVSKAKL